MAAIEFLPVIVLAALGVHSAWNLAALALAATGVYVLVDIRLEGEPVGVAFALANAVLFAAYIVLAQLPSAVEVAGVALVVAAVALHRERETTA